MVKHGLNFHTILTETERTGDEIVNLVPATGSTMEDVRRQEIRASRLPIVGRSVREQALESQQSQATVNSGRRSLWYREVTIKLDPMPTAIHLE
jgi:hypothetical protein